VLERGRIPRHCTRQPKRSDVPRSNHWFQKRKKKPTFHQGHQGKKRRCGLIPEKNVEPGRGNSGACVFAAFNRTGGFSWG